MSPALTRPPRPKPRAVFIYSPNGMNMDQWRRRAAGGVLQPGPTLEPLGGLDGTLEERLEGSGIALRGKTGHLRHVASLSGVLPDASGRLLTFVVLVNGARGGREDVDDAIDAFVASFAPPPDEGPPTDGAAQGLGAD